MKTMVLVLLSINFLFGIEQTTTNKTLVNNFETFYQYVISKGTTPADISIGTSMEINQNTTVPKTIAIRNINSGVKITINAGVTLTIKNIASELPESCFVGYGTLIIDTCAATSFNNRCIGSTDLLVEWRQCNGKITKFTSIQASTAGIAVANIDTTHGVLAYFDSLYIAMKLRADSISTRSLSVTIGRIDSITGNLKLSGTLSSDSTKSKLGVFDSLRAALITRNGYFLWGRDDLDTSLFSRKTHNHSGVYEPVINSGTTAQYWRGDKTWQTLNTSAVAEGTNLYYTNSRVAAYLTGAISGILTSNLTASRALVSDVSGKIVASSVTSAEQALLSGKNSVIDGSGTTGYIPRFTAANRLANSQIYTNGTDVAINSTSPLGRLHIEGSSTYGGLFMRDASAASIWLSDAASAFLQIASHGTGSMAVIQTAGTSAMRGLQIGRDDGSAPTKVTGVLNLPSLTASRAIVTDGSKNVVSSAVTSTELGYLSGKNSVIDGSGTTGYVPYFTGTQRLGNAPIYTNGTNVAIGKASVEALHSGYRSLQIGGNCSIIGTNEEYSGRGTLYLNNCYLDASEKWKPMVSGYASIFRNYGSYFSWQINSGLTADTQFTPTTIMSLSDVGVLNLPSLTASRAVVTDASKNIVSSAVTSTELALLSGKNSVIDGSGTAGKLARFSGTNTIEDANSFSADSGNITRLETSILKSEIDTSNSIYTNLIYFYQGDATELAVDYLNAGTVNATSIRQNWNDVWDKGALPIYYNNRGTPLDVTDDSCYLGAKTKIKTLTSDSINCTGSVRAERFYLNLSSGYVPYVNSTGNLTASSIYTGGSNNITVGKDTMVSWEVSNRAIQVGGNTAIMGHRNASSSQESYFMNNTFFDGAWKAYTNGTAMTFSMSPTQGWRFFHNSGLTAKTSFSKTLRAGIDTAGNAAFKDVTVNNFTFGTETYPGIPIRTIYMRDSVRNFVIGDTTWIYYDVIPNVGKSFIFPANYFLDGKKRWIFKFNVGAVNSRVYIKHYSVSDDYWISQNMESTLSGEIIYKLHRGTLTQIHLDNGPNQEYVYPFPGTSMSDQLQFKIFIITSSGGSGALRSATIEIQEAP